MALDLSAIAKWPDVPACYEWLSLDRRGDWRLQGERVTHSGLIAFINRQYASDASGRWFLQNGPQRVFVELAYTPWIVHFADQGLQTHTGQFLNSITACFLDDQGSALIASELGIALLDDRDLPAFLDECRQNNAMPVDEESWAEIMAGECLAHVTWRQLPVQSIRHDALARRFNFQPNPRP